MCSSTLQMTLVFLAEQVSQRFSPLSQVWDELTKLVDHSQESANVTNGVSSSRMDSIFSGLDFTPSALRTWATHLSFLFENSQFLS